MGTFWRISSYIRKPFLIYDLATAPLWISLYMRKLLISFYQCENDREDTTGRRSVAAGGALVSSRLNRRRGRCWGGRGRSGPRPSLSRLPGYRGKRWHTGIHDLGSSCLFLFTRRSPAATTLHAVRNGAKPVGYEYGAQSTYRGRDEIGWCICPLSWRVHCNFACDCTSSRRGWACTPHPHQPGLIFPSGWNVRQEAAVATVAWVDCLVAMARGGIQASMISEAAASFSCSQAYRRRWLPCSSEWREACWRWRCRVSADPQIPCVSLQLVMILPLPF